MSLAQSHQCQKIRKNRCFPKYVANESSDLALKKKSEFSGRTSEEKLKNDTQISLWATLDGWNSCTSWKVYSLSPLCNMGFIYIPGGCLGFLNHQRYVSTIRVFVRLASWPSALAEVKMAHAKRAATRQAIPGSELLLWALSKRGSWGVFGWGNVVVVSLFESNF